MMKLLVVTLSIGLVVSTKKSCTTYPCLIFEDNFDTLDFDTWQHEITASGGGNWEFQYYTNNRTNSYVKDGNLYIKPTLTSERFGEPFIISGTLDIWGGGPASQCTGPQFWGCFRDGNPTNIINPVQSARLRSVHGFSFRYGKIEVEAQMPRGDWIWPAIWMLPTKEEYGGWPASGEIDLVESRGNENLRLPSGEQIGVQAMGSTLHWGPYYPVNGYDKTHVTKRATSGSYGDSFHKYEMEWNENGIKFFLDGQEILNVDPGEGFWQKGEFGLPDQNNPWRHASKMAPFDKEFHIIMNVAVGGTNGFFGDDWSNPQPKPWNNQSPTAPRDFWNGRHMWLPTWKGDDVAMKVNYVRVWKLKPEAA